jgi:hypothetical protein
MTAEIAILNNSGIALAADSAVTIGSQKVYNSANKLFTLSKYQPVGIMVYDSADLMGIPWEIIIKEYRAELATTNFQTLKEYANHFWEFIRTNEYVIPDTNKKTYILNQAYNYLDIIYSELEERTQERLKLNNGFSVEETLPILKKILVKYESAINDRAYIDGFAENDIQPIVKKWSEKFNQAINDKLGELFKLLTNDDKEKINNQIANLFIRDKFLLRTTGVVVAGYGTSEMFPKIASYLVEGVFDSNIKKVFIEGKSNIQNDYFVTTIIPFAQDEMVWTFLHGIDPEIDKFASAYLSNIFKKYPESLQSEDLGLEGKALESVKKKLKDDGNQLLTEFQEAVMDFKQRNNSQPIIEMVGVLPKDELAAMAESLVNLTVFKRKVSISVETVGGPIDVAIISKGDGFIWVKRKHYFKPELNQQFFSNYFN